MQKRVGIGLVGAGYMGKVHAIAYAVVGSVFELDIRPELEMICTTNAAAAAEKASKLGFKRSTDDWRKLIADGAVDAVVIASPQSTHLEIASAAIAAGKAVFCEKPLGLGLDHAKKLNDLAVAAAVPNMMGFNYIRTPASQLARQIIQSGEIGEITHFRGEHSEDFLADPDQRIGWRTKGKSNGTMGDLAPHMINAALRLIGPIEEVVADIYSVDMSVAQNGSGVTENDDIGQVLCRFEGGARGLMHFSRVAAGRKMGYAYEIFGTKGAIRFDQEDQNALWFCEGVSQARDHGFKKILAGPTHPDFLPFCQGPGHGTGYQDQITIEARDFLKAIETGEAIWPTFADGLAVSEVVEACWISHQERRWASVSEVR
ncbi:MAG: Gfo/Idh/MocA family oxidoreductase [Alphaproteobacteria bacterium]|nr:Gfo/Idh/MocA family oxidoreductase [Alphaproteobacteria bacterium]